jgi:hypothetical protein
MTTTEKAWSKAMRKLSRAAKGATEAVLDKLESVTCGRCGGSGKYPSSLHHGLCLGCGGRGYRLTKRGAAAAAFLESLRKVPANTLKVGDIIRVGSITMGGEPFDYFAPVTFVGYKEGDTSGFYEGEVLKPYFHVDTEHAKYGKGGACLCNPTDLVYRRDAKEVRAEQFKKALEYQATLTQAGKPRKVR